MSLLTLKRYLAGSEEACTLRRVIALLLQGMALHAVEGDRADYERFRKDFERIQAMAAPQATEQELLITVGAANQALSDYGQRTTRFIRQEGAVLHNMISMLTQTMISVGAGSERSAENLQGIERELAKAAVIEDVQQLKLRLDACLTNVREEVARQKTQIAANASQIQEHIERAQDCVKQSLASGDSIDAVTGLRTESAAKAAFGEALSAPGRKYVAVAVANRIQSINSRFGYAVGDQLLKSVLELLSSRISSADRLFRWRGPAIVALLEREQTINAVRVEIGRISSRSLEKMFDIGGRRVLLPVTASWLVIPLTPPLGQVSKSIEDFIASHAQTLTDDADKTANSSYCLKSAAGAI